MKGIRKVALQTIFLVACFEISLTVITGLCKALGPEASWLVNSSVILNNPWLTLLTATGIGVFFEVSIIFQVWVELCMKQGGEAAAKAKIIISLIVVVLLFACGIPIVISIIKQMSELLN